MYALDFEYDGQHLSDYGFIICDFDAKTGFNIASAGSNITFNKVSHNRGKRYGLTGTRYDECIQTSFGICKNPDQFDDLEITNDEYRDLMRWLNRSEYLRFQVVYEDNYKADPCYYNVSFNINKVKVRDILYGLELNLESDKPFGYGVEQIFKLVVSDPSAQYRVEDISDEIGYTYPVINIICHESGDVCVRNSFTNCNTIVRNCVTNEQITIDCQNQLIFSSEPSHDVCNDFNYDFFKIGNTVHNRYNYITVSLKCAIEIRYTPIIKDVP